MLICCGAITVLIKVTNESTCDEGGRAMATALIGNSPGDFTGMVLGCENASVQNKNAARLPSVSFFLML